MRSRSIVTAAFFGVALFACMIPHRANAQVSATRALTFGTILAGTSTSVAPNSANAAEFRISGILGISGSVSMTLPATLKRTGGTETMTVTFCNTCGLYRLGNSNPVGATVFNPATGLNGLYIVVLSTIYIWLGGSVTAAPNQVSGSYTGTITITTALLL